MNKLLFFWFFWHHCLLALICELLVFVEGSQLLNILKGFFSRNVVFTLHVFGPDALQVDCRFDGYVEGGLVGPAIHPLQQGVHLLQRIG